ncbi:hypothetical protein B0H34DRAFT_716753 [Crassisporium funariophilum]|nr:hypothetical protein B0H34DRAFT_716753 [Crassisporium funariophilum]
MPRTNEHCENCYRHPKTPSCSSGCGVDKHLDEPLKNCAKCRMMKYCGTDCQKAHWAEHKPHCQNQSARNALRKSLGPDFVALEKSFRDWCKDNSKYLVGFAVSALGLHEDRKARIDSHVFLVGIEPVQISYPGQNTTSSRTIRYIVKSARCATMDEIHLLLDNKWGGTAEEAYAITEVSCSHRLGFLRMIVMDSSGVLPVPFDTFTIPTDIAHFSDEFIQTNYNPDWQRDLLKTFGQPLPPPSE